MLVMDWAIDLLKGSMHVIDEWRRENGDFSFLLSMMLCLPFSLSDPIQIYSSHKSSPIKRVPCVRIHRYPSGRHLHNMERYKVAKWKLRLLTCNDGSCWFVHEFRSALFQGVGLWLRPIAIKTSTKVPTKAKQRESGLLSKGSYRSSLIHHFPPTHQIFRAFSYNRFMAKCSQCRIEHEA